MTSCSSGRRRNATVRSRITGGVSIAVVAAAITACGSDPGEIAYDSVPPQTTRPPVVRVTAAPDEGGTVAPLPDTVGNGWTSATGNLADLDSECGTIGVLAYDPRTQLLYAGVAASGVYRSADLGVTWEQLGQGAGSVPIETRVVEIVFDPDDPQRFWMAGIYGPDFDTPGAYVTTDGGATFQAMGALAHVDTLSIDFADPARQTIVAGHHEEAKVSKSTDGGQTWTDISTSLPEFVGWTMAPYLIDPNTYLLGSRDGEDSGIYRTTDGGATWTSVHDAGVTGRPVVTADGTIYWLLHGGEGLVHSTDSGATWTANQVRGVSDQVLNLIALPDGRLATVSVANSVIVTDNQGLTWRPTGPTSEHPLMGLVYLEDSQVMFTWESACDSGGANVVAADLIQQVPWTVAPSTPEPATSQPATPPAGGTPAPAGSAATPPASAAPTTAASG